MAAVHDGYVLQKSVVSTPLAGRLLAQCMAGAVEGRGTQIRPRYEFARKEGHGGKLEASLAGWWLVLCTWLACSGAGASWLTCASPLLAC